jgi:UDP-N-acetylmuramate dehydrogenase
MTIDNLRGEVTFNETLANYTTWRVGGLAKLMFKPADVADLSLFLKKCEKSSPIFMLGLGSNSLIRDSGFAGAVILTRGCLNKMEIVANDTVRVEAGVSCAQMARFCSRNHLTGGEFWAGIPGTIGGALRMNAGCFNGETWQLVESVETIDRNGIIVKRSKHDFEVGYRSVAGLKKDEWFVSATIKLVPGDKEQSFGVIKELLDHRARTQPTNEYNCGSVFRNPQNNHAAKLIQDCGLKGRKLGGAVVSEKHANFIINENGEASAKDIESLIELVKKEVYTNSSIELIQEVHIIGD